MRLRRMWNLTLPHTRSVRRRWSDGLLLSAVLGIGLAILLIAWANRQMKPILSAMATAKVSNAVTRALDLALNDYLAEQKLTYFDMVSLEKDESGAITALTSNMAQLNEMRNSIMNRVVDAMDSIDSKQLSIPVGNLTGISLFSGLGFHLPVRVDAVGTARSAFDHVFTTAGINQTHHQIMLNLSVTVNILLPNATLTTEVSTKVCAAETIIVGNVPDTFLQLAPQ